MEKARACPRLFDIIVNILLQCKWVEILNQNKITIISRNENVFGPLQKELLVCSVNVSVVSSIENIFEEYIKSSYKPLHEIFCAEDMHENGNKVGGVG